jgi:hypothetical protein
LIGRSAVSWRLRLLKARDECQDVGRAMVRTFHLVMVTWGLSLIVIATAFPDPTASAQDGTDHLHSIAWNAR